MYISRRCFDDDGDGVGHAVGVRFAADAPTIDEVGEALLQMQHILRDALQTFQFAFARGLAHEASWLRVGV